MSTASGNVADLYSEGVLQPLILVLGDASSDESKISAAQEVQRFADSGAHQCEALLDSPLLLAHLCELVDTAAQQVRTAATLALWSLAACAKGRDDIRDVGGIEPLVALLSSQQDCCSCGHEAAANALRRLAISEENEDAIREAGGVAALVSVIQNADEQVAAREAACFALQNLASDTNEANQVAIRDAGGLQALVDLVAAPKALASTCVAAEAALANLRTNPENLALLEVIDAGWSKAKDAPKLPDNWDPAVVFSDRLLSESDLNLAQQQINFALRSRPQPCDLVQILDISCPENPCCGQKGLFAAIALNPGSRLLKYLGVAKQRMVGDRSDYLYALRKLDGMLEIDIDAERAGNESRFINDYRGVDGRVKNLQFVETRSVVGEVEVWVETTRCISPGEELLLSYGHNYFPT